MNNIIFGYIFSILWLVFILGIGELLIKFNKSDNFKFIARKIIHILMCFDWFIMYHFFGESYHWIILCGSLSILLLIFYPYLKSISDLNNKSFGSIIYALVATIFSIICYFMPELFIVFGLSICALSLGDGAAGVIGYFFKKYNVVIYKEKTLLGLIGAIIFSFLTIFFFNNIYLLNITIYEVICISLIFGLIELISPNKYDNLTTSISTAVLILLSLETEIITDYFISIIILVLIAIVVLYKRLLTLGGAISALMISIIIIYSLGNYGFLLLFIFFFVTTICDLIGKIKKKKILQDMHKKVGKRDIFQVFAVGLLPCTCALLHFILKKDIFLIVYVALICENLADCMASEIGVLSKSKPFDICRFKRLDAGLSGGVSLLGSISSIIGVIIISMSYYFMPFYVSNSIWIIIVSAVIGVLIDSILGSLVQRKNQCRKCKVITEKNVHCNEETIHYQGVKWINNSLVNLFSNISVVITSICLYLIF